ncbi:MAG TPA: ferritin-like domain-containing protein [Pyrinomonadaceae bacterium]|nr:ferritin-like domain-containing protein [Pyrinomonadaceae bacterium]
MNSRLSKLLKITTLPTFRPTDLENFLAARADLAETTADAPQSIGHDPELSAHDEAVFLLHTAAEVEHSLMVQYLYAAYSLGGSQVPEDKRDLVEQWRTDIIKIAKEEMGHLASVQNLLHLIGGSLNLEREDFPFRNYLYPFRFKLEPLTKDSLAKYVFAEMPSNLTGDDIEEIKRRANTSNLNNPVNHVGLLYQALADIFGRKNADGTFALADSDLLADSEPFQAGRDWTRGNSNFILRKVKTRVEAISLINDIAKQGEGVKVEDIVKEEEEEADVLNAAKSHYRVLRDIYDAFPEKRDWQPALRLPVNPNTTSEPDSDQSLEKDLRQGRITNPHTRLWAQLLNTRYRKLLMSIFHALHLDSNVPPGRENRMILRDWAFEEMFPNIRELSSILTSLPMHEDNSVVCTPAGPPFELPYSLSLPAGERNRWRLHRDVISTSQKLTERILEDAELNENQINFLNELARTDAEALITANKRIAQAPPVSGDNPDEPPPDNPPEEPNMNRFTEVKNILENAVGNTEIDAHGNFWRDISRDDFIKFRFAGQKLITENADGTFDDNESNLIKALEGRAPFGSDIGTAGARFRRMPAGLPPVPPDEIAFIKQWIKDGCPDTEEVPAPVPLSFETSIKGLFRASPDRSAMLAIAQFDLHKFEDVRDRADDILARLEDGSMPCDESWSEEKIAMFRQWMEDGKQP